ncbi:hypothetical protein LINPERHAP1_LOCUS13042 [Linum perenne]
MNTYEADNSNTARGMGQTQILYFETRSAHANMMGA